MTLQSASRRAICDLPPDPVEVQRRLQEIARDHPEIADDLKRAVLLISKQSAFVTDIQQTLVGYRWPEVLKCN